MMEKAGLWSAKELHRHVILKKVIRRPPVKYGGEVDVQPPEKKEKKAKGVKNVDKAPPMPISKKHRRTALKGEELIDACLAVPETTSGMALSSKTSDLSSSATSTSIRLIFGRIVFSRRVIFRHERNHVVQKHAY
jgi:hypothetical protein